MTPSRFSEQERSEEPPHVLRKDNRNWGALNGPLVFALLIPLTIWLASIGAGAILGGLGNFFGGMYAAWGPGNVANDASDEPGSWPPTSR